jgi:thiosulfate dehydrogenase (quinone) large subunit
VSRRDRELLRERASRAGNVEHLPRPVTEPSGAPGPSLREQLERASPAARALLPVRFFFGVTFVYAGIDKLIDPAFFDASSPSSIAGQLAAFTRVSPLAPLIHAVEPFAILIGLLIALAEIAIGLGALTGLAYRLATFGGLLMSLLFWLTASWATTPYFYGPDLPYAFGWLALTIAGHGELFVPQAVLRMGSRELDDWDRARQSRARGAGWARAGMEAGQEPSEGRRLVLQAGVLAAVSFALASLAVPLRVVRGRDDVGATGDTGAGSDGSGDGAATPGTTDATPGASPAATTGGGPTTAPGFQPHGLTVASTASVDAKGAIRIRIPTDAPSSLPAGDPGIIVRLANGSYVAYDAVCTHAGCRVGWDAADGVMLCPCHGAAFDPKNHGAVLAGPTNTPLKEIPLVIDRQAGTITLQA